MSTKEISVTIESITCARCSIVFGVPDYFRQKMLDTHDTFYCPNGHSNWYPYKTETEKLREELKRKEQELANTVIEKVRLNNELDKTQRRLATGACPCCNKVFKHLKNHIQNRHPELLKAKK